MKALHPFVNTLLTVGALFFIVSCAGPRLKLGPNVRVPGRAITEVCQIAASAAVDANKLLALQTNIVERAPPPDVQVSDYDVQVSRMMIAGMEYISFSFVIPTCIRHVKVLRLRSATVTLLSCTPESRFLDIALGWR